MRKGFLSDEIYSQIKNCSNGSEFKLVLEDTDYGSDLFNAEEGKDSVEVSQLRKKMKERLMGEFQFVLAQSTYPLNAFIIKMLHGY